MEMYCVCVCVCVCACVCVFVCVCVRVRVRMRMHVCQTGKMSVGRCIKSESYEFTPDSEVNNL